MRRLQVSIMLGGGNRGNSRKKDILKPQSEEFPATNIIKNNFEREGALESSKSSKCKRLLAFLERGEFAVLSAVLVLFMAVSARPAEGAPFAYVTNENANTVSVIDTATNMVVGSPIAVGNNPLGVAVTPD